MPSKKSQTASATGGLTRASTVATNQRKKTHMITLTGIQSLQPPEDRALAYLEVQHQNNTYQWQVFVPHTVTDLNEFLQSIEAKVLADIDAREAEWQALEPKTREITDPFGNTQVVPIDRSEIVRPQIPDYYALRRAEYPPIGDQLDAVWKGPDSPEFALVQQKIQAVKLKYPKN
jgi:hypothetical protein